MTETAISKIQIETIPDIRFVLDNINSYSHQKLLEILDGIGITAKSHPEQVANLAFTLKSVFSKIGNNQKINEIIETQVALNVQVNGIDYDATLKEKDSTSKSKQFGFFIIDYEPLDLTLRDSLIKEQERYLKNMKRLATLRKEAPEKIRSLSNSLAEAATFISDNITTTPQSMDIVNNDEIIEKIDSQLLSKDMNAILNESQNSLGRLSEVYSN